MASRSATSVVAVFLASALAAACRCICPPATTTVEAAAAKGGPAAAAAVETVAAAHSGGTASAAPPAGLAPEQVPQFVHLGFDDNGISGMPGSATTGGMRWVVDLFAGRRNPAGSGNPRTFDGQPALTAFYLATRYLEVAETDSPEHMKRAFRAAADAGHEIAIHTHTHSHGAGFAGAQWAAEIDACIDWLTKPFDDGRAAGATVGLGLPRAELAGFRAPYLEHGPPLFAALRDRGLAYDCSVEVGFEDGYDGRNLPWPYRVAGGFGGVSADPSRELWELPVYALVVPPDEECERYGVPPGLRARLHQVRGYFRPDDGKITGFDWNLWVAFQMSGDEVLATLRYSLDQRLAGNRAPLTFGTHSDIYSEQYGGITGSTAEERRRTVERFLDEALARPEVRVVSARQLLEWLRAPSSLQAASR